MEKYISAVCDEVSSITLTDKNMINEDSSLINELGADSLDIIDLTFNLGKKFKITMPTKSVFTHVMETAPEDIINNLVIGDVLTEEGKGLLAFGCYKYTQKQLDAIHTLGDLFGETNIHNWASLCKSVFESESKNADKIILDEIEQYCHNMKTKS
ncbi:MULTISPECIES: acyl carrier protein [Xenorhabdus]|uniref:acyl carrier protein n=1 Tax=Xenorhabdus TaxID=626 RepID=UPI0006469941|nr:MULTISPECIES: phosphopantetheine-binding protein [Xenorhabdus]MBC8946345.1 acyl carrier protein [Xenorhabdus indica]